MAANARETRRRRILERGSDRLALITGQIQSLPSSLASSSPAEGSKDSSSQPLVLNDRDLQPHVANQPTVSAHNDNLIGSASQHHDAHSDARSSAYCGSSSAAILSKCSAMETTVASASEDGKAQAPIVPSEGQDSSSSTMDGGPYYKHQLPLLGSFSLNQISSAISESEKARLCCSTTIAFLVVVSYIGFPFLGRGLIRVIFGFRPLYLVLLTNITFVLGRLLFTKRNRGESQVIPSEGQNSVEQIGKVLEAGLVIQKVMDAIFMDCSVFAVIIVSALSFVQQFSN